MANPVVIIVLIASSEAHDPATSSLTRAAREALGPGSVVLLQEVDAPPPAAEGKLRPDAVAAVTWTMADRKRAHIKVVIADGRTFERDLNFVVDDADTERGRAIGLAIVGMLPEPSPTVIPVPPAPPATPVVAAPTAKRAAPPSRSVEATLPASRVGLDVLAIGTTGPLGVGGGIGARWLGGIGVRLGAGMRAGRLTDETWLRTTDVTLGIAPTLTRGSISFVARVELGASQQAVTFRGSGGDQHQARYVAHVRALGETTVWATPSVGVALATGVELSFGETRVFIDESRVAMIPRARVVLEIVLRWRS